LSDTDTEDDWFLSFFGSREAPFMSANQEERNNFVPLYPKIGATQSLVVCEMHTKKVVGQPIPYV